MISFKTSSLRAGVRQVFSAVAMIVVVAVGAASASAADKVKLVFAASGADKGALKEVTLYLASRMKELTSGRVEVMEIEFPVRVERYELVPDSGGAGKFRGGAGVCRDLRILADDILLATRSARQIFPAQGLAGGTAGSVGAYILNPGTDGERRVRSTTSEFPLNTGDLLRIITPGGGGYGPPLARAPETVLHDVRQGKLTPAAARERYKVEITADGTAVDAAATAGLRGGAG